MKLSCQQPQHPQLLARAEGHSWRMRNMAESAVSLSLSLTVTISCIFGAQQLCNASNIFRLLRATSVAEINIPLTHCPQR